VEIKKTITLDGWQLIQSGKAENPIAVEGILSFARNGELLVEDEDGKFIPTEKDRKWVPVQVVNKRDIENSLCVPAIDLHRLLIEAEVPDFAVIRHSFNYTELLYRPEDIESNLKRYTSIRGLSEREAALELGLTLTSYRRIASSIRFNSNGYALKEMLIAYRRKYLPKNKIWSSRTSLLKEFVDNYNRSFSKDAPLELQYCDILDCGHIASAQCCNRDCREGQEPRFLCPAHEVWVDNADMVHRPPSLCSTCADAVKEGHLKDFQLF